MKLHSLSLKNIKKTFIQADNQIITLFDDINFVFKTGETYAITGASGSGKSTLLHILGDLEEPSSGSLLFNGQESSNLSLIKKEAYRKYSFGFIFQNPFLINELSVLENIMIKGLIVGMPYKECLSQARLLLKRIGLIEKEQSLPATLSGGQQQRVALARALLVKPSFLCADEPTGSLDKETGLQILALLQEYQQEFGMSIIMSTHDPLMFEHMDVILKLEAKRLKIIKQKSYSEKNHSNVIIKRNTSAY